MKLAELIDAGALAQTTFKRLPVKWTNEDTGEDYEFDIDVKQEMSAADHEFLYLGYQTAEGDEKSWMVRRVHRMIKLDGEYIPLAVADQFKVSLLTAMCLVINSIEKVPEEKKK